MQWGVHISQWDKKILIQNLLSYMSYVCNEPIMMARILHVFNWFVVYGLDRMEKNQFSFSKVGQQLLEGWPPRNTGAVDMSFG